jgi:hypothetical protein
MGSRVSTQPALPCLRARASAQVKHRAVHQSPAGRRRQASRAGHHQGPQLRVVDLEGGGGDGEGGREGGGRREGGESAACTCLCYSFVQHALPYRVLRVFVRSVSMFLFSFVSVAFSLSLHLPLSSRFHFLRVAVLHPAQPVHSPHSRPRGSRHSMLDHMCHVPS